MGQVCVRLPLTQSTEHFFNWADNERPGRCFSSNINRQVTRTAKGCFTLFLHYSQSIDENVKLNTRHRRCRYLAMPLLFGGGWSKITQRHSTTAGLFSANKQRCNGEGIYCCTTEWFLGKEGFSFSHTHTRARAHTHTYPHTHLVWYQFTAGLFLLV